MAERWVRGVPTDEGVYVLWFREKLSKFRKQPNSFQDVRELLPGGEWKEKLWPKGFEVIAYVRLPDLKAIDPEPRRCFDCGAVGGLNDGVCADREQCRLRLSRQLAETRNLVASAVWGFHTPKEGFSAMMDKIVDALFDTEVSGAGSSPG